MANPARAVPGGGMIPSGGGVDSLRAFVQSPDFQNLPTAVQQQILDRLGPAATGLIPSPGGGMIPPPPREPPVIRIPGGEPDVPPGGRLPPPDAPARLPGPEPDAPPPKRRGPWEALGLLGLGGLAAFWPGDDPNLDAAATPIAMEPGVGGAAGALSARSEPGQNPNAPLISPRHRARINHWAKMTGLAPTQVAGMFSQNPDQALAQLNLMSMDRSHSRQTEAADRWRATAMLAGGSHNINSGNRGAYNMLNELEGEDRDRALMYMSPAGPMAAAVDARNAEAAGVMASSAVQAMLRNVPDPAKQKLADAQIAAAELELPTEERALKYRDAPEIHPSELAAVDSYVKTNYSSSGWWGNTTAFTLDEQQRTMDYLVNVRGYDAGKAQRIVDEIARRRAASAWSGSNPMRE